MLGRIVWGVIDARRGWVRVSLEFARAERAMTPVARGRRGWKSRPCRMKMSRPPGRTLGGRCRTGDNQSVTTPEPPDPTLLMNAAAEGDRGAADALMIFVFEQLRKAAQQLMASERPGHTLSATALVHEAYLKLAGPREVPWENRAHFYAAAAEAMRRILLDHAKAKGRIKRGGRARRVDLERASIDLLAEGGSNSIADRALDGAIDFLALEDAIRRLEDRDPRMGRVVRFRFYAGLEVAQVALALGISERTVKSDWSFAKAWLERELREPRSGEVLEENGPDA